MRVPSSLGRWLDLDWSVGLGLDVGVVGTGLGCPLRMPCEPHPETAAESRLPWAVRSGGRITRTGASCDGYVERSVGVYLAPRRPPQSSAAFECSGQQARRATAMRSDPWAFTSTLSRPPQSSAVGTIECVGSVRRAMSNEQRGLTVRTGLAIGKWDVGTPEAKSLCDMRKRMRGCPPSIL